MSKAKRKIALLLELPDDTAGLGIIALRRFLKGLVRSFGIRCLSIKEPSETKAFGENTEGSKRD